MSAVSKFALAVALGAFSIIPAAHGADEKAKGKGKEAAVAAPGQNFSPAFLKLYLPFDALIQDKDAKGKPLKPEQVQQNLAKAKAGWPQVKAGAVNDDDKARAGIFAAQLGEMLKDNALKVEGLEMALASPSLGAAQRPTFAAIRGQDALQLKDYATAERWFLEAYNVGYREGDVEYRIAQSQISLKKYADAANWIEKAMAARTAAGQPIPALWHGIAGDSAANSGNWDKANSSYAKLVTAENNPNYWYGALESYRRSAQVTGEPLLDLLRLMRRTKSIDANGYSSLVNLLDQHRYPVEAEAVIAEGIANKKLTETAVAQAKTRAATAKADYIASLPTTEADAKSAKGAYAAALAGDDLFSNGDYAKARDLYALALSRGAVKANDGSDVTEEMTMRLGIAKLHLNDLAGAKAEFAKVNNTKLKPIANYWAIHASHLEKGAGAAPT